MSQLDYAARPLTIAEAAQHGPNEDPERCPADACGNCGSRCVCAPCACPGCIARTAFASRPLPTLDVADDQLVLL